MRENRTQGSARGTLGDWCSYLNLHKMIEHIAIALFMIASSHAATLVQFPLRVGSFGGAQVVTLSDNSGAIIRFSGRAVCTDDVPSSGCFTSSIVSAGGPIEFLISDNNRPLRLEVGAELSANPIEGSWGRNLINRYEFLISRSSPRDGTFTPLNDQYTVGFRIREAEGEYRYGWIEAEPHSSGLGAVFSSIVVTNSVEESVAISPIPETSSALLLWGAATLGLMRRTSRH